MNTLDWLILFGTLLFIVLYGLWKTRSHKNVESYLRGDNSMQWWMIGISIMATQASAITFLSTTGQGMQDGMRFLQFYLGLPLAMIIIAAKMVPIYYRLKVFTAYEYLETRFDPKVRMLAALLFLSLRGMSAGITLFAPSIVLSTILDWPIMPTMLLIGGMVFVYTIGGGSKAVNITQRFQLTIMMGGIVLAGIIAYMRLPADVSFTESIQLAGELGKLNIISTDFSWSDRYNIWSGLLASTFLFLAYFGTDQSQVGRYLDGKSIVQSRIGLLMNGLLKLPMQFIILFIGVVIFLFYLFNPQPVHHNERLLMTVSEASPETIQPLVSQYNQLQQQKQLAVEDLMLGMQTDDAVAIDEARGTYDEIRVKEDAIRASVREEIAAVSPDAKTDDRDYMFLNFVLHQLPNGIIGLLMAVIFSAAMSSLSSELNALGSTSTIDFYKRWFVVGASPAHYVTASKWLTTFWAGVTLFFAFLVARQSENLIQFVNIVGSLFYGTILGIFLAAFYVKYIKGTAVFYAALLAELVVVLCFITLRDEIAFLYFNIIGCLVVLLVGSAIQAVINARRLSDQEGQA